LGDTGGTIGGKAGKSKPTGGREPSKGWTRGEGDNIQGLAEGSDVTAVADARGAVDRKLG
jgi:hypothetical protein